MKLLKFGQILVSILIVSLVVSLLGVKALNTPESTAGIIFISPGHYIVTFHNNWPIGIGGVAGRVEVLSGKTISQLAMPMAIPPPDARHGFKEWNTSAIGIGQTFDSVTPIQRHMDVFAIWDVIDNGFIDAESPEDRDDDNNIATSVPPEPPTPALPGGYPEIQVRPPIPPIVLPPGIVPSTPGLYETIEIDETLPLRPYIPRGGAFEKIPSQSEDVQVGTARNHNDEIVEDEVRMKSTATTEQLDKQNETLYKQSWQNSEIYVGQVYTTQQEGEQILQAAKYRQTWALVNLLLSLIGIVFAIIFLMCIAYLKSRKKFGKIPKIWLVALLSSVAAAPIIFTLTQNMGRTMVILDFWTIMHCILIGILTVSVLYITKKGRDLEQQTDSSDQMQEK